MSPSTARPTADRIAPSLLLALTVVPTLAGAARLVWLVTGEVRPDSARFAAGAAPLVLHILAACGFCILGALQFAPALRRRRSGWHRAAGRFLAPLGLFAALSGLWITLLYPPGVNDGALLYGLRLVFGSAMAASILMGMDAIRRRDFPAHGDWMTRGYAIGMGAGTQVVVFIPWTLLFGPAPELPRALLMGAGWGLNLVLAEALIARRRTAGRLLPT